VQWRARPISSMLDAAGGVMKGRAPVGSCAANVQMRKLQ
jgi:hypothetical protein